MVGFARFGTCQSACYNRMVYFLSVVMRYRSRSNSFLPAPLRRIIRFRPRSPAQVVLWLIAVVIALMWATSGKLLDAALGRQTHVPFQTQNGTPAPSLSSKSPSLSSMFTARVVHVDDGDTVVVQSETYGKLKVRLSSIDAPETAHGTNRPGQPFGEASKAGLQRMVHGKDVMASCFEVDRYQRHVCKLEVDGLDVNAEMVRLGLAWVYRSNPRYVRDKRLYQVEDAAQADGRGVWSQSSATPPWRWRKDCWQEQRCG